MSETVKPKPSIEKLESLINETQDGEVEVRPNGDVVRLNVTELMQKNLRLEQERNEALRGIIKELRERLSKIHALTQE